MSDGSARSGLHPKDQDPEKRRLQRVYEGYRVDPATRSRWDARNRGNICVFDERRRVLRQLLERNDLFASTRRVLDVGCGSGHALAELTRCYVGARSMVGVDVLGERVAAAHQLHPEFSFVQADGTRLSFRDSAFDLVLAFTVFSSILDDSIAVAVAREITRVVAPGGAVAWYDLRYPNPANRNVRPMSRGRLEALFPRFTLDLRSATVLPPFVRRLGPFTELAYPVLAAFPPLRSHCLGILTAPRTAY